MMAKIVRCGGVMCGGAGDALSYDLNHAVEQVASAPLRWPRFEVNTRRYVFRLYPYSLIYRTYGEGLVRVLAVAHDSRRSTYWLSRAKDH
ncbi:MAG: type II toxin-antitoxin system RelE/ParE family toxin [bacterium]